MFLLYSLVYTLAALVVAPYYLWRMRGRGGGGDYWRERMGRYPTALQSPEHGAIWVHAVSVGETLAVAGLVRLLQRSYPERGIFLSHVTPAGREAGEKRLPAVSGRFYLPFDWAVCVRRALERVRPAVLLIVETELWPNLLREAERYGAKVVLVNARLSERSFRGYRLIRPLMRALVERIDLVCAQTETDADRFRLFRVNPERVRVTGNMKFDVEVPEAAVTAPLARALATARRAPVMVAASTMPGEETLLLDAWREVRERFPNAILILAPRHPARFEEVARLLGQRQASFIRRTDLPAEASAKAGLPTVASPRRIGAEAQVGAMASQIASAEVLFLDTIGELAGVFTLADVVFVGGSLVARGGHNLLEPAYSSKAILFGPHMENFRDTANLFLQSGGAMEVHDVAELARRAQELLGDREARERMGEKAKQVLEQGAGATHRVLEALKPLL